MSVNPNSKKRGYSLPAGCKDLIDVLKSKPVTHPALVTKPRVNGMIRARNVSVIGADGKLVGILTLGEALKLARSLGVDLVQTTPNKNPPTCQLIDFGKFRYRMAKRAK